MHLNHDPDSATGGGYAHLSPAARRNLRRRLSRPRGTPRGSRWLVPAPVHRR